MRPNGRSRAARGTTRGHGPRGLRVAWGAAIALGTCGGCGGHGVSIPPFSVHGGVVVVDLDGDGLDDVAVTSTYIADAPPHPGVVEVYRQSAPGLFDAPLAYDVGADPWGLSAGDVDGDGRLDLVAASPGSAGPWGVAILRQDPAQPGRFLPFTWVPTGTPTRDADVGELTGDAAADVAASDGVQANARVLLLEQDPVQPNSFLPPVMLATGAGRGSDDLVVADVDGDHRADLVVAVYAGVAVLRQLPGGGFAPPTLLSAGLETTGVAVGDLDGDGRTDIVAANAGNAPAGGSGGSSVTVLLQTSPGSFARTDLPVADGARRVAIGDLDGDLVPDLAVVSLVYQSQHPSRVSVVRQSSSPRGAFTVTAVYDGTFGADALGLGDTNGDGRLDVVLNDGPAVLRQRSSPAGTFDAVTSLR